MLMLFINEYFRVICSDVWLKVGVRFFGQCKKFASLVAWSPSKPSALVEVSEISFLNSFKDQLPNLYHGFGQGHIT